MPNARGAERRPAPGTFANRAGKADAGAAGPGLGAARSGPLAAAAGARHNPPAFAFPSRRDPARGGREARGAGKPPGPRVVEAQRGEVLEWLKRTVC